MTDRTRIRLGRLLSGTSVSVALISIGILAVLGTWDILVDSFALHNGLLGVGFGSLAWVTIRTQARNRAVWSLAWGAFFGALFTAGFAVFALLAPAAIFELPLAELGALSPSDLPVDAALALQPPSWAWVPAFLLILTLGLLLFPDGGPPSPRWRWVGWFSVAMMTLAVVPLVWLARPSSTVPITDPIESGGTAGQIAGAAMLLVLVGVVASVAGLIVRYRRSSGVTRRQIRWIAWGGSFLAATLILSQIVEGPTGSGASVPGYLALVGLALLILSFAVAITKYRLYDIDIVISRTMTYTVLAALITGVYALIVVGIGSLLGQGDQPDVVLSIAAIAFIAVTFEPVRLRVARWANRLVYGTRATPHEVLSQLTTQLSVSSDSDDTLANLARLVTKGTGASETVVWLRIGGRLRPEAADPHEALNGLSDVTEDGLPRSDISTSVEVRHGDELLGALSITKPRHEPPSPADERLLEDVAAGAGLLLRNMRLNAELAQRAQEVRASRRRLIAAHDSERHRLERDLHDGAQQQVVALKVKLGLAKAIAEQEGAHELALAVASLADETQSAVDQMRELAHGIYPPLLEAEGLGAVMRAAARSAGIPVDLEISNMDRYSRQVEETAYFCMTEMIGEAVMARATNAEVLIQGQNDGMTFKITYDVAAHRLDTTTLADRIDAAEGTLKSDSTSEGTTVTVRLPGQVIESV